MRRDEGSNRRLYLESALAHDEQVVLAQDRSHYLRNVMRLGPGDSLQVFNGRDGEWSARIAEIGKRSTRLRIEARLRPPSRPTSLHYAFAPLKHARLDYLIQKAVEMGVAVLQPVITRRTQVVRFNLERARANAIEAAEQCGLVAIPEIRAELALATYLRNLAQDTLIVFCDEEAPAHGSLAALGDKPAGAIVVLVGPEGGFDEPERQMLLAWPHVVRLTLGPRILRADTAAVAALALVQARWGDWRGSND